MMTWQELRERLLELHREYCDGADGDHRCNCSIEKLLIDVHDNALTEHIETKMKGKLQ